MENKEYIQELLETIIKRDIDTMERDGSGYCVHNMEYLDTRTNKTHVVILKTYLGKNKNEAKRNSGTL